jgi:hypothetical protein
MRDAEVIDLPFARSGLIGGAILRSGQMFLRFGQTMVKKWFYC